ncbi:hypothetical protein GCM10017667_14320 [Streptomyces filamentosus]|uniref:Putative Flp pilus-assembly TadG-like N-terminal domain-containing protein n=1 Tax=Streptomyces filamentosus TaxID=67294 RepID=A0A919EJI3_STRFL|nr:hypothetical protein GCM10017667_14320 [Streptomyces filamentosus]
MVVVAGILFLAFVYFAVGQASMLRNGVQTAADAAALGAAQDARDQLLEGWLEVIDDPALWQRFVRGDQEGYFEGRACQRAAALAALNDAELRPGECIRVDSGFTVTVQTRGTVGESIVPGTDGQHATATATAVIEPLCKFDPSESTSEPTIDLSTPPPSGPDPSGTPSEEPEKEDSTPISTLICDGEEWEIDLESPVLPGADDLFRVRLTGDDE